MPDYGPARFETTVIRDGDDGLPSVRAILTAAQALNLGVSVTDNFESVRLPHPPNVVLLVLELAGEIDEVRFILPAEVAAAAQSTEFGLPVTAADYEGLDDAETDIHACDGQVHIVFNQDVDGLVMSPEDAMQFAEEIRGVAAGVLAEKGGADAGGATEA